MKIIKEYASERNRTTKPAILEIKKMSTALASTVYNITEQTVMSKSMVPDYQAYFTLEVKVHKKDSEMCRLVEQPWLQLMYCTVCLPYGRDFR